MESVIYLTKAAASVLLEMMLQKGAGQWRQNLMDSSKEFVFCPQKMGSQQKASASGKVMSICIQI